MNIQQGPEILFWLKFAAVFLLPIAVEAYFCGCFNGAVIVSKYILRDDVRNHGSGKKWNSRASLQKQMKWGGLIPA